MINHERESLHSSIKRNDAMMEAIKERLQRKEASEKHTFSFGSDERQIVDVYLPTTERSSNEDKVPLLIFLHGGAWVSENVGLYEDLARYISSKGIAVALPEYRLTRYKSTTKEDPNTIWHPNHIEDVYQGINIIFAKSKALGYSTNDTVLVGHSAGGWMNLTIAFDSTKANDKSSEPLVRNLPQINASFVKSIKSFVCVESIFSLVDLLKQYPTYNYFTTPAFYPPSSQSDAKEPYSDLRKAGPETWPLYPTGSYHLANPNMPNIYVIHSEEDSLLNREYNERGINILHSKGLNLTVDLQTFKGDHEDLLHTQPFWDRLITIVRS